MSASLSRLIPTDTVITVIVTGGWYQGTVRMVMITCACRGQASGFRSALLPVSYQPGGRSPDVGQRTAFPVNGPPGRCKAVDLMVSIGRRIRTVAYSRCHSVVKFWSTTAYPSLPSGYRVRSHITFRYPAQERVGTVKLSQPGGQAV